MQEQRKRVRSGDPADRLAAALLIPAELSRRLRLLSNSQLARLLDTEVCSNLNIFAPEMTVCAGLGSGLICQIQSLPGFAFSRLNLQARPAD
jgi:hypothetical protein